MLQIKDIAKQLCDNIGKYRTALMGFSMMLVFIYHAQSEKLGLVPTGIWADIMPFCHRSVDMFLFLSAFGLCFSMKKNSLKKFYSNRFKRIIPTWWVILISIHIIGILVGSKFDKEGLVYPHSITDMFFWYTGLGFYFNQCHYDWFIPALLFFYLLVPTINKLPRNYLLLVIFLFIPLIWLFDECGYVHYLYPLVNRVPSFLLGVLFFKDIQEGKYHQFFVICAILFVYVFAFSFVWDVPSDVRYFALLPFVMGLIGFVISFKYTKFIEVFLSFIGTISLEFYLIHPHRRPQYLIGYITKDSMLQVLGAFVLVVVLSYLLHLLMKKVNEKFLTLKEKKSVA